MRSGLRGLAGAATAASFVVLLPCLVPAGQLRGQEHPTADAEAKVDSLLAWSRAEEVLAGQARALANQLRRAHPALTDGDWARLGPAMEEELAYSRLRRDLGRYLLEEAPAGRIEELLDRFRAGATARIDSLVARDPPSGTLEGFMEGMGADPPDPERLLLVGRWAEARSEGDFYVVLSEAVRQAAHRIAGELVDSLPAYEPMDEERYLALRERSFQGALVSYLYRYRTVPLALLREAVAEWESEAAAWFVEACTLGMAEVVMAAGERVAERLGGAAPHHHLDGMDRLELQLQALPDPAVTQGATQGTADSPGAVREAADGLPPGPPEADR